MAHYDFVRGDIRKERFIAATMIPCLNKNFKNFKPNAKMATNITRHMNKVKRKNSFLQILNRCQLQRDAGSKQLYTRCFFEISKNSYRKNISL
jgi:hypothetical protein